MKITKRQLKRIIKEEKRKLLSEGERLPITQGDYDVFVENVLAGLGWIDPDDVRRQWEGMFGTRLSEAAVNYLLELLDEFGLLGDAGAGGVVGAEPW